MAVDETDLLDEVTSHMSSKRFPKVKDALDTHDSHRLKKTANSHKSSKTSNTSGKLRISVIFL